MSRNFIGGSENIYRWKSGAGTNAYSKISDGDSTRTHPYATVGSLIVFRKTIVVDDLTVPGGGHSSDSYPLFEWHDGAPIGMGEPRAVRALMPVYFSWCTGVDFSPIGNVGLGACSDLAIRVTPTGLTPSFGNDVYYRDHINVTATTPNGYMDMQVAGAGMPGARFAIGPLGVKTGPSSRATGYTMHFNNVASGEVLYGGEVYTTLCCVEV